MWIFSLISSSLCTRQVNMDSGRNGLDELSKFERLISFLSEINFDEFKAKDYYQNLIKKAKDYEITLLFNTLQSIKSHSQRCLANFDALKMDDEQKSIRLGIITTILTYSAKSNLFSFSEASESAPKSLSNLEEIIFALNNYFFTLNSYLTETFCKIIISKHAFI